MSVSSKRRWLLLGALAGLGSLAISDLPAQWLVIEDAAQPVDAAVVLAGDPGYERTIMGAGLVLSGQARLLVVTGGDPGPGDSARSLRDTAVSLGVAPSKIRMEEVSHGTRASLIAVSSILHKEGVASVALVTSPYHQRRAFLAARRVWPGLVIVNRPAAAASWAPRQWWISHGSRSVVLSEYAKLLYYAARGWV